MKRKDENFSAAEKPINANISLILTFSWIESLSSFDALRLKTSSDEGNDECDSFYSHSPAVICQMTHRHKLCNQVKKIWKMTFFRVREPFAQFHNTGSYPHVQIRHFRLMIDDRN